MGDLYIDGEGELLKKVDFCGSSLSVAGRSVAIEFGCRCRNGLAPSNTRSFMCGLNYRDQRIISNGQTFGNQHLILGAEFVLTNGSLMKGTAASFPCLSNV
jgi:hypothetical protein